MSRPKKYHRMIDLSVECRMAGAALLLIAGGLQERHANDEDAGELQIESIDQAANGVLKALAVYTAAKAAQ